MTPETVLLRQAHPRFLPNGELTSEAFLPDKNDPNLSTYNGDNISPADSFKHYTTVLKLEAQGTWGISCAEVVVEGLASASDPLENHPHHCIVQFGDLGIKALRRTAKKLKEHALKRGRLHPA